MTARELGHMDKPALNPARDGIDHINVYSRGNTVVGRWMSNWYREALLTEDGDFASVEGYWYWLGTHDDRFRTLAGWDAKQLGRAIGRTIHLSEDEFRRKIRAAIHSKAAMNPAMMRRLVELKKLPLTHYYVYDGNVVDAGFEWILEIWEELRCAADEHTVTT